METTTRRSFLARVLTPIAALLGARFASRTSAAEPNVIEVEVDSAKATEVWRRAFEEHVKATEVWRRAFEEHVTVQDEALNNDPMLGLIGPPGSDSPLWSDGRVDVIKVKLR
jgi:hypothetical protein